MAIIVFLRGVNVGGHKKFHPSDLARELSDYEVVNVGATGTFVVHKPQPRGRFTTELLRKLPFPVDIMFCEGRDLLKLEFENPFGTDSPSPDTVRFVSILSTAARLRPALPIALPEGGAWCVRVLASKGRLVFGEYRRDMKTIGYLGQIDKLFGVRTTTRNWNTIMAVLRILKTKRKGC